MRRALTIAGSDSGGGAGIQADLKTFAAHGVFGLSAITAVTAQNTLGVRAWQALAAELVLAQIEAVVSDLGADAVKIGMLGNVEIVRTVARAIDDLALPNIVLDPVMIAKGGASLIDEAAVAALRAELLPRVHVVTPNIPEAEALSGSVIRSLHDMRAAGEQIRRMGPRVVLVKGGHLDGPESIDVVCTMARGYELRGKRIVTRNTHGTGCTLSAAIAANLATGLADDDAVQLARRYLEAAIEHGPAIGEGHRPLGHFWRWAADETSDPRSG